MSTILGTRAHIALAHGSSPKRSAAPIKGREAPLGADAHSEAGALRPLENTGGFALRTHAYRSTGA